MLHSFGNDGFGALRGPDYGSAPAISTASPRSVALITIAQAAVGQHSSCHLERAVAGRKLSCTISNGRDGADPNGDLVLDAAGNLYGTTYLGGIHDGGTAFELSPREGGGWTETVLHSFGGNDGFFSSAGLIMDGADNLYGVTVEGGIHGLGTVFELSRRDGGWAETVLHSFALDRWFLPLRRADVECHWQPLWYDGGWWFS